MALQLHVKISVRYTKLKFQLGLVNSLCNLNKGLKFQIFHLIDLFSNRDENSILCTREFLVYF